MVSKTPPIKPAPQPAKPLPVDPTDGADGGPKPASAREKKSAPDKEEIRAWISELHAGLTSDDTETVEAAARLCRRLALRAAERLGLIIFGIQAATPPQVVMSSITVMKAAGMTGDRLDAGVTAETVTE
jgi:hypothetical protein